MSHDHVERSPGLLLAAVRSVQLCSLSHVSVGVKKGPSQILDSNQSVERLETSSRTLALVCVRREDEAAAFKQLWFHFAAGSLCSSTSPLLTPPGP